MMSYHNNSNGQSYGEQPHYHTSRRTHHGGEYHQREYVNHYEYRQRRNQHNHHHHNNNNNQANYHSQQPHSGPETLSYVDSKGIPSVVSLIYIPEERDLTVQCCDPFNERMYYLPRNKLDRTTGLETHIHNPTGRKAQICMKHQQHKCNMKHNCLQIHADYCLVEALRELYHADKKIYVSEVIVIDTLDGRNDTLSFRYSEIESGAAKDAYRKMCSGKSKEPHHPVQLCGAYISRGSCSMGPNCYSIHVSREKYLKAKAAKNGKHQHQHQSHQQYYRDWQQNDNYGSYYNQTDNYNTNSISYGVDSRSSDDEAETSSWQSHSVIYSEVDSGDGTPDLACLTGFKQMESPSELVPSQPDVQTFVEHNEVELEQEENVVVWSMLNELDLDLE
eukprot:TRINITY_DN986_c9_g1_i1.p1 TRINITY_DN986_c9_g1~~TRINITY_DN986_c9_g1_i1.p1  ORF type:complete len:390 (+),score=88.26 TRINITY_DN986_c9_g1_i1:66-1235(+)